MSSTDTSDNVSPLRGHGEHISPLRTPPHNSEAEMALLGAILANNRSYERVQDFLTPEHFVDPAHGAIYAACGKLIDRGQLATPVTLKNYFESNELLDDVGGAQYLAKLANAVITISNAQDLGRVIYDCYLRRELIDIGEVVVNRAYEQDLDEPATHQIEAAEERLFSLAERGVAETGLVDFKTAVVHAIEMAEAAYKRDSELVGVPTGFTDVDGLLGGLHDSDLVIVAGRPSMGKTAFATNLAYNTAMSTRRERDEHGVEVSMREVVAFFSLEMSAEQLATRVISEQAHVRSDAIRRGNIRPEEYERVFAASQMLYKLPLFIDDTPALTIASLHTRARRLKRQHGLSLIVVDYLQLMQPPRDRRHDNRVQEVSEITRGLKAVAKDLNVPVLALSQLSRAVEQREDKRPQLADLRESGSIEQDADVVIFLYREEYYREREKPIRRDHETDDKFLEREDRHEKLLKDCRNKAELILAKQRHGPIGSVRLRFEGDFTRFSDLAQEDHMAELR